MRWQRNRSKGRQPKRHAQKAEVSAKEHRPGDRVKAVTAGRAAMGDMAARVADTAVPVVKAAVRAAKAGQVVVQEDHDAGSANISARRRFASSVWRKWT